MNVQFELPENSGGVFSAEECRALQSEIFKEMNAKIKQGITSKQAHAIAASKIAHRYGMDEKEFSSRLATSINVNFNNKGTEQPKPPAEKIVSTQKSMTEMYADWCSQNEHVAPDKEIGFWSGYTPPAAYYARRKLIDVGFVFEADENGFSITHPEPKELEKTYTEAEVRRMMEELISKYGLLKDK